MKRQIQPNREHPRRPTPPGIVLLLLVALLVANVMPTYGAPESPAPAQPTTPVLVNEEPVTVEVPLGAQQDVTIEITNNTNVAFTPVLYEAFPAPAPGTTLQSIALPESLRSVDLPAQSERVDPQIAQQLAESPNGEAEFLVFLGDQPDLSQAYAIKDWSARGWYVYETLYKNAEQSQRELREWLDQEGLEYTPLWIANALRVTGTHADLQALVARTDVALLRANYELELAVPDPIGQTEPAQGESTIQWHVSQIQADRVWNDFGVSGQGVVVANIDSGVNYTHPALFEQYRGNKNGTIDNAYNWFDASADEPAPIDAIDHGTHVMGLMVARGNGTETQPAVGVAPGAEWIAARACLRDSCLESDLVEAAQWMLAPTDGAGDNARPDLRPHIINNSFAGPGGDDYYLGYTTAWRAAGIFPVFAAGNAGARGCNSIGSPGDYSNVVAVGSTNRDDLVSSFSGKGPTEDGRTKPDIMAPGDSILSTGSASGLYTTLRGTSMASPIVAGSVALLWAANPDLIGDFDATYQILTTQAVPRIDDRFIGTSYIDCPATEVPNNVYGYGRIDTYAAVSTAEIDIPWLKLPSTLASIQPSETQLFSITVDMAKVAGPGTYAARILVGTGDLSDTPQTIELVVTVPDEPDQARITGTVRAAPDDSPISANITVDTGLSLLASEDGTFELTLPPRAKPYEIKASAYKYYTQTQLVTVTRDIDQNITFVMPEDIPRLTSTIPFTSTEVGYGEVITLPIQIENTGTQPLTYEVRIPTQLFTVRRSNERETPLVWFERPGYEVQVFPEPEDSPTDISTDDAFEQIQIGFPFSFNGQSYEHIYIGSNGFLVFEPNGATEYFTPSCGAFGATLGGAIAPLHIDLNPEQGGSVWYAQTDNTLVVTYEDVPLYSATGENNHVYTFQVILQSNGRILFNYKELGNLTTSASVGTQINNNTFDIIDCGTDMALGDNLTLELRPQANSATWITTTSITSGSIPPRAGTQIRINITGAPPFDVSRLSQGSLELTTNDPYQSSLTIPIEIKTGAAPYQFWLPMLRR
ncbi:MAG: S8 family serine peptidase [Chloroflexaceae bacterium]|nr:S8 family serine peptidase [Chloroflexaceae bacterium]